MTTNSSTAGNTRETPVDLTGAPRPRPTLPTNHSSHFSQPSIRRPSSSSISRLPRWQPDNEASQCPVCRNDFGFWNRRHHCRKCGRVVCAACSPHRITIPRQYIVQPPNPFHSEIGLAEGYEAEVTRALGGGAVVRVCNPCVPDPWTPDNASARGGEEAGTRNASDAGSEERAERRRYMPLPPPSPPAGGRIRSQSHQPAAATLSRSIPGSQPQQAGATVTRDRYTRLGPPSPHHSRPISHRYSHSHSHHPNAPLPPVPPFIRDAVRPSITTAPSAPPQPKPRREIREEDECPVCGNELPPGEQLHEAHIQDCIASRFSSTPSSSSTPAPAQTTHNPHSHPHPQQPSSVNPNTSTPSGSTTPTARPRATSYKPRGMALYRATEKDCIDESGDAQECVICFEEFQPGDEMGRMECLCKFHRHCIRGWWERKGGGSCPTHQLHD